MEVATMRTINPTAIATIRRLIDRLIIDPERPIKRWSMNLSDMNLFDVRLPETYLKISGPPLERP
jgi:hypothetical protein